MPSKRISTREIPQADTLENVVDVVEFVSKGYNSYQMIAKKLGLTERQGRYYRLGAELLGFIKNIRRQNISILTELGRSFLNADNVQRRQILFRQVMRVPVIQGVIGMLVASNGSAIQEELSNALLKVVTDSTQSMVKRRLQTILSWLETLGVVTKSARIINLVNLPNSIDKIEIEDLKMPVLPRVDDLRYFESVSSRTASLGSKIRFEVETVKRERANVIHERLRSILARRIRTYESVPTFNRYIDLATRINDTYFIIEVKTSNANVHSQIRKGISQLYEYRYIQCLPDAKLVLLIENALTGRNAWLLDYIQKDRGIYVIWNGSNDNLFTTEEGIKALPFMARSSQTENVDG